ncbi:hypothetical protein AAEO50_19915 [Rossellomorea oryzaecorticis]|uniref:XRE family transcriptional regulator n=1 Tax=Rossellomorea oryzaecorticis TaxID=1396505 RepID=A0ABU9KEL7_9BACI
MLQKEILVELQEYIALHLNRGETDYCLEAPHPIYEEEIFSSELEDFIKMNRKPTLQQVLFHYIDQKGVTDSAIYKKAGLDRRHFSKIRSNPDYHPKKHTAIALAFALELDIDDTEDLLSAGGYSLSDSDTSDLIVRFFLNNEIFDLQVLNETLDHFQLKTLNV